MVTYQNFLSHMHQLIGIYNHDITRTFQVHRVQRVTFFFIICLGPAPVLSPTGTLSGARASTCREKHIWAK